MGKLETRVTVRVYSEYHALLVEKALEGWEQEWIADCFKDAISYAPMMGNG